MKAGVEWLVSMTLGTALGVCGTSLVMNSSADSSSSKSMTQAQPAIDNSLLVGLTASINAVEHSVQELQSDLSRMTSPDAGGQRATPCVVAEPESSHAGPDSTDESLPVTPSAEQEALFEKVSQRAEYMLSVGGFSIPEFTGSDEFLALTSEQQLQLMSGIAVRANRGELDIDSLFPAQ